MGLTYDDIIERINKEKGVAKEEIEDRIKQKLNKLSGLISKEGAAHIVANELGVDLISSVKKTGIKISTLTPGMRNITIIGNVVKHYGTKTYNKEGRQGKLTSFLVGDDSGLIRIIVWDEHLLNTIEQHHLQEGTTVRISDGLIKENNGYKEMHLGNRSTVDINPPGVIVTVIAAQTPTYTEKHIAQLQPGDLAKITGTVVQVYEPRFYQGCQTCGKKTDTTCLEHPATTPVSIPVINFHFDDGTGNIRAVAFRDTVSALLNQPLDIISSYANDLPAFEQAKQHLLGSQLLLEGKAQRNDLMASMEFITRHVEPLNPSQLANKLSKEIDPSLLDQ